MENLTEIPPHQDDETSPVKLKSSELSGVFVIPRATMNYIVIAVIAFFFGSFFNSVTTNRSEEARRAENQELISQAVAAALDGQNNRAGNNQGGNPTARLDVSVDDDPFWGPVDAPVTIIEFSDFQCPYCGRFQQETYPRLQEMYGDRIRFVYRDFPILQLHPNAAISAQAANCANEQGNYWEYHNLLLTNQDQSTRSDLVRFATQLELDMNAFNECFDSGRYEQEVNDDVREGSAYGVQGTPTFFINGRPLVGAQPFENFAAVIDEELAAAEAASNP